MSPSDLLRFLSKPANTPSNHHTVLGLDNTTPVVTSSHFFQYPFFKKAEFSSARPDTLTGIGIFQDEGNDC
ncbi:hypothetical protein N7519_007041 [Penicillium mononematosum]|uniref:uncharacterized protein n=1 Tax=Penicillium mononematosum TaxID=268346 RepID=UPI0025496BAF|nr:uncharacterized protein N7519_007041 [Penicillium mononematosum]KAJ6185740.1 hypothetical protein N7519_007041 [Penicillium mononematosum]